MKKQLLLQNQDRHITLPIIYVSFPLPQYIENANYGRRVLHHYAASNDVAEDEQIAGSADRRACSGRRA